MYTKKQRILALCGVAVLVLLVAALLLSALLSPGSRLFYGLLFAVIAFPILLWIYIWLFGKMTGKKTIADFETESMRERAAEKEKDEGSVTISKRSSGKTE